MFGVLLAILLGALLYGVVAMWTPASTSAAKNRVLGIVMGGYGIRMLLQSFLRDIPLFSHGIGGDNQAYEKWAKAIVAIWEHGHFEYITKDVFWQIGDTSLPPNLFALVFWANGEPTRVGCSALVAFAACMTCWNLYTLAVEHGATEAFGARILALLVFGPAFLMYTSDMYKDGLVAFFVVGALGSAFRLANKISLVHVVIGVLSLVALWFVRYYLIFVTMGPLLVGIAGLKSKSSARPLLAALLILAGAAFLLSYTGALERATETFDRTFAVGTSAEATQERVEGGSGVVFDDGGSPFGALHLKIAYTLMAPFPWQSGSIGLQLGKLDAFVWYYILFLAIKAGRHLYVTDRRLLIMFLVFLLPTTLLYALGMANIGLTVRERMPIVLFAGALAALSERRVMATDEGDDEVAEADGEDEGEEDESEEDASEEPELPAAVAAREG
jgi:hypothetical protein